MNWTGGRLQRHSRQPIGSLTQKQKRYFAKARKNANQGKKRRSNDWSLFENADNDAHHKLLSLPRPSQNSGGDFASHPSQIANHNDNYVLLRRKHALDFHRRSPSKNSEFPSTARPITSGSSLTKNNRDADFGWNGYNDMDTFPRNGRRTEHIAEDGLPEDGKLIETGVDTLEERKRRILHKGDWVGASIQRPIQLKYAPITNDKRIGKRRRLSEQDHQLLRAKKQIRITSPLAAPRLPLNLGNRFKQPEDLQPEPFTEPRNHVRIYIGGRQVRVGADSSTTHTKTPREHFPSPRGSTSDIMLLDGSDTDRRDGPQPFGPSGQHTSGLTTQRLSLTGQGYSEDFKSHIRNRSRLHKTDTNASSQGVVPISGRAIELSPTTDMDGVAPLRRSTRIASRTNRLAPTDASNQDDVELYELEDNQNEYLLEEALPGIKILRGEGWTSFEDPAFRRRVNRGLPSDDVPLSVEHPSSIEKCITHVSKQLSASARKLRSVAQSKSQKHASRSMRPLLHHPKPQSSMTSQVLRSDSSELVGSVAAQVGKPKTITPASQALEEEMWRTWILQSDDVNVKDDHEQEHSDIVVSPGISNITVRAPMEIDVPSSRATPDFLPQAQSMYVDTLPEGPVSTKINIKVHNGQSGANTMEEEPKRGHSSTHDIETTPIGTIMDFKDTFRLNRKPALAPQKSIRQENSDEAWMKFILSDNSWTEDDPVDSGQHVPGIRQQAQESSLIVEESFGSIPSTVVQNSSQVQRQSIPEDLCGLSSSRAKASMASDPHSSIRTTRGSDTSSDPLSRAPDHLHTHLPDMSSAIRYGSQAQRKITFTRPRPYRGNGHNSSSDPLTIAQLKPLHIGGRNRNICEGGSGRRIGTKQSGRDVYSLSSSEEVEDIEDD